MSTWQSDELSRIAAGDDLHVSPLREDGRTHGTPTWIWSVAVEGALYVRAYHGTASRWYQAALRRLVGRIQAQGFTKQVRFEPVDDAALQTAIDAAYQAKYRTSAFLGSMISPQARLATMRVVPVDSDSPKN